MSSFFAIFSDGRADAQRNYNVLKVGQKPVAEGGVEMLWQLCCIDISNAIPVYVRANIETG